MWHIYKAICCKFPFTIARQDLGRGLSCGNFQTRIFGTIRNSDKRDPVKNASITLSIEGTQIGYFLLFSGTIRKTAESAEVSREKQRISASFAVNLF